MTDKSPDPGVAVEKVCERCEGRYLGPPESRHCGADCARPRGRKRSNGPTTPGTSANPMPRVHERKCESCRRTFLAARPTTRYCGNGCRGRAWHDGQVSKAVLACAEGWRTATDALRAEADALRETIAAKDALLAAQARLVPKRRRPRS